MEIADNLSEEGAVAKAGAVYKKILKLKPDHERALCAGCRHPRQPGPATPTRAPT